MSVYLLLHSLRFGFTNAQNSLQLLNHLVLFMKFIGEFFDPGFLLCNLSVCLLGQLSGMLVSINARF